MILSALLACSGVGLAPSGGDSAEGRDGAVRIEEISPGWGPVGGGTEVTIVGEGLEGRVSVAFGRAEVDAVRIAADTILVTTPDAGAPMTVDVTVRSDLGEDTLRDGFSFGEGGTGGGDTGSGGSGGGSSGVGGLVELSMLVYGCPSCFGLSQQSFVSANAVFHDAVRRSWLAWLPEVGSCTAEVSPQPAASRFLDAGEWVYLSAGSTSLGLRGTVDADGARYEAAGLSASDFLRSAAFDLRALGGADVDGFEAVDAVRTPQGFDDLQPIDILNDGALAFSAAIPRTGATFTWAPSGGDGTFVVLLQVFRADGSALVGNVLCRGADNGRLTVPGSFLSGFPRNALVAVTLQRYQIGNFPLPGGATGEAVATLGAVGTGVLP